MQINPSSESPCPESQAKINLEKLLNSSPANAQAEVALAQFLMIGKMLSVFAIVNSARSLCGLAALQAGFNSADETATAGHLLEAGGLVLGAAGVVQGAGNFKEAAGVAKATEIRNNRLTALDEEFNSKDITLEVEALEEPCSHTSNINDDIVLEVEEDVFYDAEEALSNKQAKAKDQKEEIEEQAKQDVDKVDTFDDIEKNKRIKLINKDYEVETDITKSQASKLHAIGTPGQAAYYAAQGLSELQKAKSQKEGLIQQVQQDNQNQQGNTADGIKREVDKLTDFDPFQRNSSSQR